MFLHLKFEIFLRISYFYLTIVIHRLNCYHKPQENVCSVQLNLKFKQYDVVQHNQGENQLQISKGKNYTVVCETKEKVRIKSVLKLIWDDQNGIQSFSLSNNTNWNQDSYRTQGHFLIDPNSSAGNYKLYCQFLTLNPRIYCEKQLDLQVMPYFDKRLEAFILILLITVVVIILIIVLKKLRLKRMKNKNHSNSLKSSDLHYWDRISRF